MASSCKFTTLYGDGPDSPSCHLLQFDGFALLIGCGWDESFEVEQLQPIVQCIDGIDAVILSHADLAHLGALPYLVSKCGLSVPVYSTLPVRRMGEMFMTEIYHAKQAVCDFGIFDLQDINKAFSDHPWTQLRYFQRFIVTEGKMAGISLTPYNAGHMVGGAMWKVGLKDGSEVMYAADWCHKKERHLNRALISELPTRPALMIAGAAGCLAPQVNAARRDTELLEVIVATLRGDGCVLIPVDAAGRMLEVALLLEEFWAHEKMAYPLVLLSHTCTSVFSRAQQQLEWMSEHIGAAFGAKRDNPFALRFLHPLTSLEQLAHLPAGPKVVLACSPTLEVGFARQLLLEWAPDPKNTVCFVDYAQRGTLADQLQRHVAGPEPVLQLEVAQRVPLSGTELEMYMRKLGQAIEVAEDEQQHEHEQQQQQEALERAASNSAAAAAAAASKAARSGSTTRRAASLSGDFMPFRAEGAGLHDVEVPDVLLDGFQPPKGCSLPMFPDEDEPMAEAWDAYGALSGIEAISAAGPSGLNSMGSLHASGTWMEGAKAGDAPSAAAAAEVEEEGEEEAPEIPTKLVTVNVELVVRAAIRFFDFSGRADGKVISEALKDSAPRHLILVHGTPQERVELARSCELVLADFRTRIACPMAGQPVHVPLPPTCTMFLSDELNESMGLQRMNRYALAQLEAVVGEPDPHHPALLQLLPSKAVPSGEDVFVADSIRGIQLSQVIKALSDAGLNSIFQGGRLVCGQVAISRGSNDKAHLVLEGALCEDFYRVREVIYSQFSVC